MLRNQIYQPDHIIVLDPSMVGSVGITQGLKTGGTVLINGKQSQEYFQELVGKSFQVFVINAAEIAVQHHLGSSSNPIVNTAIIGAFARATGLVKIESVEHAIEEYVPVKKENNIKAAQDAYQKVIDA